MIAGIVLAAGESKRMGQPKQLLKVGATTMLNRVVDAALASKLDAVYVVVGHRAAEVKASLEHRGVAVVLNPEYAEGIGASVRAGLAAVGDATSAAMFLLADQPFVSAALINRLIVASTSGNIVAPVVEGRRGNPTVFGRMWFPELLQVRGDSGGRSVIAAHPEALILLEVDTDLRDVDTPEDAAALRL